MDRHIVLTAGSALVAACGANASYLPMLGAPEPVADPVAAVYLVGDAGSDSPGRDAVLDRLRTDLSRHVGEHPTTPALVVFLGDNIYDVGARRAFRAEDLGKLSAQVDALVDAPTVRGVFVPGNHDWGKGAEHTEGKTAIQVQQEWISQIAGAREVGFLPSDECPGPVTVSVAEDVHVVLIDTEWLLRLPEDDCGSADRFYERLAAELRRLQDGRIVIAAHHPMATGGPHGGNVALLDEGPVLYYLAAKSGLSVQDLASGRYSRMLERLRDAIGESGARPLAMVAGHDHSLQVIRMHGRAAPRYQLVSGSGSKSTRVGRIDGTRFATSAHGWMRIDVSPSRTRVVTFALDSIGGTVEPVFACELSGDDDRETCAEAPHAGQEEG